MVHIDWNSQRDLHVDHFNPTLTHPDRNRYGNLFLASSHCNGLKSNTWPTRAERKRDKRFLNPRREMDYGGQIFEVPETHRLVGTTPAARYHIRILGLNAPHLVNLRKERSNLHELLQETPVVCKTLESEEREALFHEMKHQLKTKIPHIPPPPQP